MALNIKDPETERLVAEVAALTGETKTATIRAAVKDRLERLTVDAERRAGAWTAFLESEVWPQVPDAARRPVIKEEREEILGYGAEGV